MINDNMSLEDLTKHFTDIMDNVDGKYTKIQYRTFTDDWNSLSVSVRQELADMQRLDQIIIDPVLFILFNSFKHNCI